MNIEKMREEFEAWHVMNCSAICPRVGSEYKAWVASRETLVIDLTSAAEEAEKGCHGNEDAVLYAAQEAIEAAGLKVKP